MVDEGTIRASKGLSSLGKAGFLGKDIDIPHDDQTAVNKVEATLDGSNDFAQSRPLCKSPKDKNSGSCSDYWCDDLEISKFKSLIQVDMYTLSTGLLPFPALPIFELPSQKRGPSADSAANPLL